MGGSAAEEGWCREEIAMAAGYLGTFFAAEDFQLNRVWVHQTNRYLDYPQLEAFNFFSGMGRRQCEVLLGRRLAPRPCSFASLLHRVSLHPRGGQIPLRNQACW